MPSKSHENDPPTPATPPVTVRLLRSLGTDFDPLIQQLRARLTAPDAASWVASVELSQPGEAPLGELEQLVREALRRAVLAAAGDADALVGIDESVLQEVWALLLEHVPAAAGAVPAAIAAIHDRRGPGDAPSKDLAPQFVGNYELLDTLGEGASGTVFRARHRDNGLLVAVKVLRAARQDSAVVTRFRLEAKLVAQLEHPSIVAVRDSGVERHAGLATPYIVYELVAGRPFREALQGASTDTVLAAFASACEAIEYSHRHGILHRDIKSGNVLVDAAGGVHVLDFGIARPAADPDRQMTRTGEVLGTPSSMSPEQAAARKADARTDIYSLGVLLFEALSGEMPHRLDAASSAQLVVAVASTPARSLASVCPSARTDLVAVVDTALAFAADDRYPTVAALLEDVRRLRAGQPVSVSRPSAWHVLRLFARRNKRLAATALAFAFVSVVTATSLFVAWRESVGAAERGLRAARLVASLMAPMVETSPTRGEAFERNVRSVDLAIAEFADGSDASADRLETTASLYGLAGDLALRGDRLDACRSHRERAAALFEQAIARGAACAVDHARLVVKLGDLDKAESPSRAKAMYERAHRVFESAAEVAPGDVVPLDEIGWSYERLAALAWSMGKFADAFELAKKRVTFVEQLAERHPDAMRQYHLASALGYLWMYSSDRPAESGIAAAERLDLARRAREAARVAVEHDPNRGAYQSFAIKTNTWLGREFESIGDLSAARSAHERAAHLADAWLAQDSSAPTALVLAAWTYNDHARCLERVGEPLEAEQRYARAAALYEKILVLGGADGVVPSHAEHFRSKAAMLAARRAESEAKDGNGR